MECVETGALLIHQDSFNLSTLLYITRLLLDPSFTYNCNDQHFEIT
jgi:hypothetical protein